MGDFDNLFGPKRHLRVVGPFDRPPHQLPSPPSRRAERVVWLIAIAILLSICIAQALMRDDQIAAQEKRADACEAVLYNNGSKQ
jgi:hypothetical protein